MFYFQRQVVFLYVDIQISSPPLHEPQFCIDLLFAGRRGREAKRVFYYVPSLSIRQQQGYHIKVPKNFKERNNVPTFFDVWEVGGGEAGREKMGL